MSCHHLKNLSLDNPFHAIWSRWRRFPIYGSLTALCARNEMLRNFERGYAQAGGGSTIDLKDQLKIWVLTQNEKQCPTMAETISRASRKNNVGPIGSIYWPDSRLAFYSFRWRCNRFCLNYTCLCGERLTRGHLERCWDRVPEFWTPCPVINAVDTALNANDMKLFEKQLKKMQERPYEGRTENNGRRFRRL